MISLNRTDKAKLAGLEPHSKYRVTIKATTAKGPGLGYYTECDTNPQAQTAPSMPNFRYTYLKSETEVSQLPRIKVTWQPFVAEILVLISTFSTGRRRRPSGSRRRTS